MGLSEPPVRIRNAEDLFEVLSGGSLAARLAVLRDIQHDPLRAVALGPHEGEDFVDLLIRLIPQSGDVLKQALTICLMSYDDPRSTEFLLEEFARCRDAATVLHLVNRLLMNVERGSFRRFLWEQKDAQALAASRVCRELPDLTPDESLRIAILLDSEFEPPPISKQTLDLWVKELTGYYRLRTRQLARKREGECLLLWTRWEQLGPEEREWLLKLTEEIDVALAKQSVATLLNSNIDSVSLARAAVRLELELPAETLQSRNVEVRGLAVSQGLADPWLEDLLENDQPLPVVLAAVGRCSDNRLPALLQDDRWQVRAEVLALLSQREAKFVEEIRTLSRSELLSTRTAAVKLLLAWGDDEWLRENLLSES